VDIKARQTGNCIILDLVGRIDADSANLIEIVGQCLRDGYNDILCNFESVDFIDYLGISALVLAYKEVVNSKGRMKFSSIPTHLKGVFLVSGLDRVIDMYISEDLAITSFKEDQIIEKIKKMQLRRRFKRLPIDLKIEFKAKYDKKAACLKGEILNLSGIGAFIFGCGAFQLGDELILKLKLPPKQEELELDARVVWLPDKQIQPHFHPGIGIEFHNISGPTQNKLIEFIERNLSRMSTDK
jgi:anti-anti-sigma factor